jgi:4-carboxymuconolactone decarboxylase
MTDDASGGEPLEPGRGDERLERGRRLAQTHLGEGVTERWRAISPDLEELTSAFGFADLWGRPGLSRRDRSIVAMAITATLRAGPQLGWHVRGALGSGVTPDEVREVLIAVSGLAGFPAAWTALEVAEPILAEQEAAGG